MLHKLVFLALGLLSIGIPATWGQTAEQIINAAIEKTGGVTKWQALNGFRIKAKFDQGGVEFPLEIVQLKDGRQYTKLDFQGTEIKQGVYDGKVLWSTDFQTQKPKKADQETTQNVQLDTNDFPDELIGYQSKGYKISLEGSETLSGKEVYKIKLVKEAITIKGSKSEDVVWYYFDLQTSLPVAKEFEMKHGPIQGSIMVITLDDYRQVNGLWFPFSMSQGVKDAPPQPLSIESIELNPKLTPASFSFPGK
jgi:hypothetical protein